MELSQFKKLLVSGFDVEFNIKDIFFSFTKSSLNGIEYYFIGNENYSISEKFETIDNLLKYQIDDKTIEEIVKEIPEEEICY